MASLGWIDNATAAKISSAASNAYPQTSQAYYSISIVNHNTILRLREYARESNGSISNKIISTKELDINDFVTVTDPNPAEKSGYQSSLSEKDLANNSTLKKYADLITMN